MATGRSAPRPGAFALAADDFGLTRGVSRAILDLGRTGRLSGTGAMTNMEAWREEWPGLRELDGTLDLGVHLTLTLGRPLGPMPGIAPAGVLPPFGTLARRAFAGRLDAAEIEAELARQVEAFAGRVGRLPDYLDGHQHAHVLPGVRQALLRVVDRFWPGPERPWIRDPFDSPGRILARGVAVPKAKVIAALSVGLGRSLRARGIPANRGFSGVSPFDPARDFGADFRRFLAVPGPAHLVMCHPGSPDDPDLAALDPVVATRPLETAYLASGRFVEDLAEMRMSLERQHNLERA